MTSRPNSNQAIASNSDRQHISFNQLKESTRSWASQLLSSRLFCEGVGRKEGFWVNRLSPSQLFEGYRGDATVLLSHRTTTETFSSASELNSPRNTPLRLSRFSRHSPQAQSAELPDDEHKLLQQNYHPWRHQLQQQEPQHLSLIMQPPSPSPPCRLLMNSADAAGVPVWANATYASMGGDSPSIAASMGDPAKKSLIGVVAGVGRLARGGVSAPWKSTDKARPRHHLIVVQQEADLEFYLPLPPSLVQCTPWSPRPHGAVGALPPLPPPPPPQQQQRTGAVLE